MNIERLYPIGYRLRLDIQWKAISDSHSLEQSWIASDPLTRSLFRCGHHEYQILQWINESTTSEQIIDRFNSQFRPRRMEASDLKNLLGRCIRAGILQPNPPISESRIASSEFFPYLSENHSESANERSIGNDSSDFKQNESVKAISNGNTVLVFFRWLARSISKWMQCQVPLVNPDAWLAPLARGSDWLYSRAAVWFWLVLSVISIVLITLQFELFLLELPSWNSLRSPATLVGLGIIFVVTRMIHELGHAIVCKRFGASCKEMGVLVSFGMICPYVDITDAWRLDNRYARMSIAIAGIYNEIIVAALAALIWAGTYPGWLHTTAMQTFLVCSITTLLFNANPLMKYDGYFILCDWLNIQNLRERSFEALDNMLGRSDSTRSLIKDMGLILYFFASSINRIVISISVAGMVYAIASQWQLAGLGLGLIVFYACCSLVVALASWQLSSDGTKPLGRRGTVLGWVAVSLLIAWILNEPLPNRVASHGSFLVGKRQPVYALTAGRIVEMIAPDRYGMVIQGTPLVLLVNEALERSVLDLEAKLAKLETQLATSERVAYFQDEAGGTIPLLKAQREVIRVQLEQKNLELMQLAIISPTLGRFEPSLATPLDSPENPTDSSLGLVSFRAHASASTWNKSKSLGRFVDRGVLLGWVVEDNHPVIECKLNEEQLAGIAIGTEVRLVLKQNPTTVWQGRISEIASTGQNTDESKLTTAPTALGSSEEKKSMLYQVRVRLKEQELEKMEVQQYMSGSAEIVFVRPNKSLVELACEFGLRNFRLR